MTNFVTKVLRGQYKLFQHYWGLALLCVPINLMFLMLARFDLSLGDAAHAIRIAVILIAFAVFLVGYVGLINCARREHWRAWAVIGVVVATLGLFVSVGRVFMPAGATDITGEITMLNTQLPKKLDEMTLLTKATYDGKQVTFAYQVSANSATFDGVAMRRSLLESSCSDMRGRYARVNAINYVYHFANNSDKTFSISQQDCAG